MPHAVLRLVGGANTQETPALNENSGISQTQLVRFMYDPNGISLVQKIGGWVKFFATQTVSIVRALWAWEDLNLNAWLALGTQTIPSQSYSQLAVINDGTLTDISPTQATDNVAPQVTSQAGSYSFLITDPTTVGITNYDSVYIATQISIGGIVLFGLYACSPDGILLPNAYTVWAKDVLGNLTPATSTSSMPVLPSFTTVGPTGAIPGSSQVTVNLPNYTYAVGDTFAVLTPTMVGGITLYGNYVVQTQVDANNFTIIATSAATSSATGTLNGGLAEYIYSFGQGAIPSGTGYGIGGYGLGGYGTGVAITPATGPAINAVDWTMDNFGADLICCPIQPPNSGTPFQPIYVWPPGQPTATVIPTAPPVNDGILVAMPQRQVIAWGSTETGIQDPLLIQWSDVGTYNVFTDLVTNQAGTYRIPTGSRIVGCLQVPQQIMVWTDVDVYSMTYINLPDVYGFNQVGKGCGMIARKGAGVVNGIPFWMGPSQFYSYSAYGVQPVPCGVWDQVFQNLNTARDPGTGVSNLQKIRCAVNSRFGEIQWFYPSATGSGEVDSYVKFNVYLNVWDYGTLGRSAWVDQTVLGPPIGADPSSLYLYQHETSNDADGQAMGEFFRSGYFVIGEGDQQTFCDWVWPDAKWGQLSQGQTGQMNIWFYVAQYPGDTPIQYGPYTVSQATEYFYTRFRGRLVSVQVGGSPVGTFWRIGALRYRFAPDGRI